MKNYLLLVSILTLSCNSVEKNLNNNTPLYYRNLNCYPKEILKNKVTTFFDETRWAMYCIHCLDTCKFLKKVNIKENQLFGTLDLRFEKITYLNDTTELSFCFYRDTLRCDVNSISSLAGLTSGAAFKGTKDSIIYYLSRSTIYRIMGRGAKNRYAIPLQPEVIAYIKSNKDKLNSWFREEAKRRKIIE